jgi:uncharacterized membrane protein YdjX (TVP38/TMEM64 family)
MTHAPLRRLIVVMWLAATGAGVYGFVFHHDWLSRELQQATSWSSLAGSGLYLALGCLRAFALVPATALMLTAIPFFAPTRLFCLTLAGIAVASATIYALSDALHLEEVIAGRHRPRMARLKAWLERHELPVIIAWSFFPLVPTDLICYVCGVLRVPFWTMLVGVVIGEGAICAAYIYFGDWGLRALGWR